MKVLFLDIDGVLNSTGRARNNIPYSEFIPEGLEFLRYLVSHGVLIVVSSTWRIGRSLSQLSEILTVPVFATTPVSQSDSCRGDEIQQWLDLNERTEYCIVDDDSDMLPNQRPMFVQTNHEYGMQSYHMAEICRVLSLPSNPEGSIGGTKDAVTSQPLSSAAQVHPVVGQGLNTEKSR